MGYLWFLFYLLHDNYYNTIQLDNYFYQALNQNSKCSFIFYNVIHINITKIKFVKTIFFNNNNRIVLDSSVKISSNEKNKKHNNFIEMFTIHLRLMISIKINAALVEKIYTCVVAQ